jgi:hypothetical protein
VELAAIVVREPICKFSVHSARGAFVGYRFDEEDMHASVLDPGHQRDAVRYERLGEVRLATIGLCGGLIVQLSKRAPSLRIWSHKSCEELTSAQGLEPTE